ncbi:MAG: Trp family transcriptional regulator [bacterium]|nr:Trp family transcriptional regulator [bacterium]
MPKVSRIPLAPLKKEELEERFWQALAGLCTARDLKMLLMRLCTRTEITMFIKRLEAAKMLLHGDSYKKIRKELTVTDAPLMRLNNLLHENKSFRDTILRLSEK